MDGIQFVTDDKGRRVAVQINLKKYVPFGKTSGTALSAKPGVMKRAFLMRK